MRKKGKFKEKYADELDNKDLKKWLEDIFSEEEINNLYNGAEGMFQGMFKIFQGISGSENIIRVYLEQENFHKVISCLNIEERIKQIIESAFNDFLLPENSWNAYVSSLWDALCIIMGETTLKKEDKKVAVLREGKYYLNGEKTEVMDGDLDNTVYVLKTHFDWVFEARLEDNVEIKHLVEKGSRKNHTLKVLLGELVDAERDWREFECYLVEDKTNIYCAWELYSIVEGFLAWDSNDVILDLVKELAYELGKIHNLEVRIQVLYKIREIVDIIMGDEDFGITKGLKKIVQAVKDNRAEFNEKYDKLLYALLFLYQDEEKWKKLKELLEGREVYYFSQLWNKVRKLKNNMDKRQKSYLQMKFEKLWWVDNKSREYRWFNNIWCSFQKDK